MNHQPPATPVAPSLPRRRFVQGLAGGGVLLGLSPLLNTVLAQPRATQTGAPKVLSGTVFNLEIGESPVNFTGSPRMATTVNGSLPAPTLHWREGDTITIHVKNHLKEATSIHWRALFYLLKWTVCPVSALLG